MGWPAQDLIYLSQVRRVATPSHPHPLLLSSQALTHSGHLNPPATCAPGIRHSVFYWKYSDLAINLDRILTDSGALLTNSGATGGVGDRPSSLVLPASPSSLPLLSPRPTKPFLSSHAPTPYRSAASEAAPPHTFHAPSSFHASKQVPCPCSPYALQKRRKSDRASSPRPYDRAPAARAVANSSNLGLVHAWPEAQILRDVDAPWLWPHELDAVIRGAPISTCPRLHSPHHNPMAPMPHFSPPSRLTHSTGSIPNFVAQKPDSVKIRSKCTADRKILPRIDQLTNSRARCRPPARGVPPNRDL
jgi:hypothetical protein